MSGLARGCDTHAHEGCLEAGGVGVAVLAHGLDRKIPALAERLLERGGALVSEYPIGTPPRGYAFVERDRLQSGLSDAVLVIETGAHGGAMHALREARRQGRPFACLDIEANRHLIRAGLATAADDVQDWLARGPSNRTNSASAP